MAQVLVDFNQVLFLRIHQKPKFGSMRWHRWWSPAFTRGVAWPCMHSQRLARTADEGPEPVLDSTRSSFGTAAGTDSVLGINVQTWSMLGIPLRILWAHMQLCQLSKPRWWTSGFPDACTQYSVREADENWVLEVGLGTSQCPCKQTCQIFACGYPQVLEPFATSLSPQGIWPYQLVVQCFEPVQRLSSRVQTLAISFEMAWKHLGWDSDPLLMALKRQAREHQFWLNCCRPRTR